VFTMRADVEPTEESEKLLREPFGTIDGGVET
jgi:hypothetical protein